MAPKDLYYLPQVFIVTKDGSKEEFAGITQFRLVPCMTITCCITVHLQ